MPYFTVFPDAVIPLNLETPIVNLGGTQLLNIIGSSTEFSQYDVDATGTTVLKLGDDVSLIDESNTSLLNGTFAGTGTMSIATFNVNVPLVANLDVQVDPISGSYIKGDDEKLYFVTDDPLADDYVKVTVSGTVLVLPVDLTLPISQLTDSLLGGALTNVLEGLNAVALTPTHDPNGTLLLTDEQVFPCFTSGTLIDTPCGPIAVNSLSVGDLVLTADHSAQPVRWIGRRRFSARQLAQNPNLVPIRIRSGALGPDTPSTDLVISPQHRVLVRSRIARRMFNCEEILIAAKHLLRLDGVEEAHDLAEVEYVHILFDRHEVVLANGAATELLYLGPEAIKALPDDAVDEILTIFPELILDSYSPVGARLLAPGRQARKLAQRHLRNRKPLC